MKNKLTYQDAKKDKNYWIGVYHIKDIPIDNKCFTLVSILSKNTNILSLGFSFCHEWDNYNKKIGLKIAFHRALNENLFTFNDCIGKSNAQKIINNIINYCYFCPSTIHKINYKVKYYNMLEEVTTKYDTHWSIDKIFQYLSKM